MHVSSPRPRLVRIAATFLACCTLAAGCGVERPVSDASQLHPNGIGLDIETVKPPTRNPGR